MMITPKQQAAFWTLWSKAESENIPRDADRKQRDTYRRSVIFRACGKVSLKDINPTRDFDRLMYAVAALSGDYKSMAYWCNASERRTAYMIGECARQIGEIVGEDKGWEYCRSIFAQANLPPAWMDIPDGLLFATFEMMDTHRRRLLKRDHGWTGERNGQPLGFNPDRTYIRRGLMVDYYDPIPKAAPVDSPAVTASA